MKSGEVDIEIIWSSLVYFSLIESVVFYSKVRWVESLSYGWKVEY